MAIRNVATTNQPLPRGSSRARHAIAIGIVLITALAVASATDLARLGDGASHLLRAPTLLAAFVVSYAGAFYLRAVAWTLLAPGLHRWQAFSILHASLFANHAAPVKAGEVLRPALAARRGLSPSDAVASSIVSRLLDVLSLVVLVAVLAPRGLVPGSALAPVPLMAIAAALIVLLWLRLGGTAPWGPARLQQILSAITGGLRAITWTRVAAAAALTLPSWALEGSVVYIAATSVGVGISPATAIAATAFTLMFQIFHVTPGGIGMYESAMTGALVASGVAPVDALSIAVLAHTLKFAYSFTFGLGLTLAEGRQTGRNRSALPLRRPLIIALAVVQTAIVIGYFAGEWEFPQIVTAEALLIVLAATATLVRQWLGAWRPLPATTPIGDAPRPIVAVIPAYNEVDTLPLTLARIPRDIVNIVVVVDDGSSDGTTDAARKAGADIVITHERNRGLGAALRTALHAARGFDPGAVVYCDADGEYDPTEAPRLLGPILSGDADYVLGSRNLGTRSGQLPSRKLGNAFFTRLLTVAAGRRITDGQTGFRAFSPRALAAAEIVHDYNYAQVLTLNLLRKRMRMAEVPITWTRRATGQSFVRMEYLWRVPLGMLRELTSN